MISEEIRLKMRVSHLGKKLSESHKQKIRLSLIGRLCSETTRRKIGDAQIGEKNHAYGKTPWNKGKKLPQMSGENHPNYKKPVSHETRIKISKSLTGRILLDKRGSNCHFWKGGVTSINEAERKSTNYRVWRKAIFERDNYTCQECKIKGGYLHAHHIKSFAWFPELRFAIDNGVTLCVNCHKATDTYGGKNHKTDAIDKVIKAL